MKKLFLLSSLSILFLFSSLIWSVEATGDPYEVGSPLGQWLSEPENSNRNLYKIPGERHSGYLMDIFWIDPTTGQVGFTDEGWSRVPEESHHLVFRTQNEVESFFGLKVKIQIKWEETKAALEGLSTELEQIPRCPGSFSAFTWHNCVGIRTHSCEISTEPGIYAGQFVNGRPNGQGQRTYKAGQSLGLQRECDISNDRSTYACGGRDTCRTGSYLGEWKDGKRHGQGTFTWSDGKVFVGEWKEGKRTEGTETHPDGYQYVGEWEVRAFEYGQGPRTRLVSRTKGTEKLRNGGRYVGELYEDDSTVRYSHGQGTYTFPDGREYIGEWKNNLLHGQGTYTWTDGREYIGEWKGGKRHGQGTYTWPDGREYIGEWKSDQSHGLGNFYRADGSMMGGRWDKDEFVDGYAGEGCSGDSALWSDCIGTLTLADGEAYIGEFKKGKAQGWGMIIPANGYGQRAVSRQPLTPDEIIQWRPGQKVQAKQCDSLCELEKSISLKEAATYVAYAEKCASNHWMEKADSEVFVNALNGMIKRGISESRVSKQAVNQTARLAETLIASGGFTYDQKEICQGITLLTRQFIQQPKDRY